MLRSQYSLSGIWGRIHPPDLILDRFIGKTNWDAFNANLFFGAITSAKEKVKMDVRFSVCPNPVDKGDEITIANLETSIS